MTAQERARAILADAISIPPEAIPDDAAIGTVEQWDSLGHMRLLIGMEEALKRQLSTEEAANVISLADVARLLG
jgi:acyl carrier protein